MPFDVPIGVRRLGAALVVALLVPALVTLASINEESPLTSGQIASRDVVAREDVRVENVAATEAARDEARRGVDPTFDDDVEAQQQTLSEIARLFSVLDSSRADVEEPVTSGQGDGAGGGGGNAGNAGAGPNASPSPTVRTRAPTNEERLARVQDQIEYLDVDALTRLVQLDESALDSVQSDIERIVDGLLRIGIVADDVEQTAGRRRISEVVEDDVEEEVGFVSWPSPSFEFGRQVAIPIIRNALRPNQVLDVEEFQQRQQEAEEAVDRQFTTFIEGELVVEEGEEVSDVQFEALERLGQAGSDPGITFIRALLAMAAVVAMLALYFQRSQPELWVDPPRLYVLAVTMLIAALLLLGAELLVSAFGDAAWFAFPIGGLVLLIAVLTNAQVGLVSALPLATMGLLFAPSVPALAILVTAVVVVAAPMVERISTRVGLRQASVRVAVVAPALAVVVAVVFGPREPNQLLDVAVAATVAGVANVGLLQGLLPAFENTFRLATVTALLDLADRNHPLLRELERKAMGSYNHSVMVASLAERCCREIGANHLLGQVAGLYHDIGKVRQPLFFIENQRGIANPHDQLTPRMSAVIIQNHVKDGVEMATEHRLPPDVVDCIASHHGTMRVSYFYKLAVDAKDGDASQVDESHFRYKGHRPRSKEAAVLLLADCTEAATRAMAMDRGTLPTDVIESTVDRLVRERLEDGQFEDCALTFTEFQTVRDTLVEALTGIYHPRIGYPPGASPPTDRS